MEPFRLLMQGRRGLVELRVALSGQSVTSRREPLLPGVPLHFSLARIFFRFPVQSNCILMHPPAAASPYKRRIRHSHQCLGRRRLHGTAAARNLRTSAPVGS